MLIVNGRHNGRQIFCNVVLMPIQNLDGIGSDISASAPNLQVLKALVDTGATDTNIAPSVVQKLNLAPVGMRDVSHGGGSDSRMYYLFNVGFLNDANDVSQMIIPSVPIEGIELPNNDFQFDVILGMDVLSQGRLVVTGHRFEFTLPVS